MMTAPPLGQQELSEMRTFDLRMLREQLDQILNERSGDEFIELRELAIELELEVPELESFSQYKKLFKSVSVLVFREEDTLSYKIQKK